MKKKFSALINKKINKFNKTVKIPSDKSCSLRGNIAHKSWSIVSVLNKRHQLFAWLSLIWVGLTDIYVRLVSSGVIIDINTW